MVAPVQGLAVASKSSPNASIAATASSGTKSKPWNIAVWHGESILRQKRPYRFQGDEPQFAGAPSRR